MDRPTVQWHSNSYELWGTYSDNLVRIYTRLYYLLLLFIVYLHSIILWNLFIWDSRRRLDPFFWLKFIIFIIFLFYRSHLYLHIRHARSSIYYIYFYATTTSSSIDYIVSSCIWRMYIFTIFLVWCLIFITCSFAMYAR